VRRRKLLVALAVGLVGLAAAALWPRTPRAERITLDNYYRIDASMTRAEVEAILGPPGDYRTGPTTLSQGFSFFIIEVHGGWGEPPFSRPVYWTSDTLEIVAYHYSDGTLSEFGYRPLEPDHSGPLDNLRWRAKRLWRQWFPPADPSADLLD
jgi:hypothetical protein